MKTLNDKNDDDDDDGHDDDDDNKYNEEDDDVDDDYPTMTATMSTAVGIEGRIRIWISDTIACSSGSEERKNCEFYCPKITKKNINGDMHSG